MKMNTDPKWIKAAAEKEDGCYVGAGDDERSGSDIGSGSSGSTVPETVEERSGSEGGQHE